MSRPGIFNRLRSYIWHEQEPNTQINITVEEAPKAVVVEQPVVPAAPAQNHKTDGPNEELRSFFEANGDRELSKVEVLGVLNLISQAVARDESVLDLSNVSRSANSSAFPPQVSTSFSTSNLADLTGNRSISRGPRSRRPLASGPKRQSAKSLTRSQSSHSGISMPKVSAPVETRSRRPVGKPLVSRPAAPETPSQAELLGRLDEPMDDDDFDSRLKVFESKSHSTLRTPLSASTPAKPAYTPAFTPRAQKPVENLFASKPVAQPAQPAAQPKPVAQPAAQPHTLTKDSSVFAPKVPEVDSKSVFDPKPSAANGSNGFGKAPEKKEASTFTFGTAPAVPAAASKPVFGSTAPAPKASEAAPAPAAPKPFASSASSNGPSKPAFKSAVPDKDADLVQTPKPFSSIGDHMEVDVDMDFDFPETVPEAEQTKGGEEYMGEFIF